MNALALDTVLVAAVTAVWLSVVGFARLRTPLDRLHCVTFLNLTAGTLLAAAALLTDGVSNRSLTVVFIVALNLLCGAATSHVTGRAFLQRGAAE